MTILNIVVFNAYSRGGVPLCVSACFCFCARVRARALRLPLVLVLQGDNGGPTFEGHSNTPLRGGKVQGAMWILLSITRYHYLVKH